MISPQLEWLASPCSKCLRGAGLSRKGVDSLLAVGGAKRAPSVLKALGEAMGQEPTFVVNPDEAACLGAAISAAIYDGELDRVVLLSAIGKHREWSRSYDVVRALAFNPGTPAETAMKPLDRLSAKDLDALLETKDLPRALKRELSRRSVLDARQSVPQPSNLVGAEESEEVES